MMRFCSECVKFILIYQEIKIIKEVHDKFTLIVNEVRLLWNKFLINNN